MAVSSSIFSSEHKRLLAKAVLFAVVMISCDFILGAALTTAHHRVEGTGFGGGVSHAVAQRNEVLIFGSSRAMSHYNPRILSEQTGLGAASVGIEGTNILSHYCLEQLILARYTPRVIVLDLIGTDLEETSRDFDSLSIYLPYYREGNEALNDVLLQRSKWERLKLSSRVYPYNSTLLGLAKYNVEVLRGKIDESNGFHPYRGMEMDPEAKLVPVRAYAPAERERLFPVAPYKPGYVKFFVETARGKGVTVLACKGPYRFVEGSDKVDTRPYLDAYAEMLNALDVPIITIDETTHPQFNDSTLFRDDLHLNAKGADVFSALLAQSLDQYL